MLSKIKKTCRVEVSFYLDIEIEVEDIDDPSDIEDLIQEQFYEELSSAMYALPSRHSSEAVTKFFEALVSCYESGGFELTEIEDA